MERVNRFQDMLVALRALDLLHPPRSSLPSALTALHRPEPSDLTILALLGAWDPWVVLDP